MKKLILKWAANILYKIALKEQEKEDGSVEKSGIVYTDFDKDGKNDLLELADKIALVVAELEKKKEDKGE